MPGIAEMIAQREGRTAAKNKDLWSAHAKANRGRIGKWAQTFWQDLNLKTGVLIAAGPSLADSVEELRGLDRSKHDIVVVDMALGFLLKAGIRPDYVICSDASVEIARTLEVPGIPEDLPLLLSVVVHPETGASWKGPVHWFTTASNIFDRDIHEWMEQDHKVSSGVPCSLVPGGNVASLGLSFLLGVRAVPKLLLYGADFCWTDDSRFYCGGVNGDLAAERIRSETEAGTVYAMKDTRGRAVRTNGSLLNFVKWFHDRMAQYPGVIENRTPRTILTDGGASK